MHANWGVTTPQYLGFYKAELPQFPDAKSHSRFSYKDGNTRHAITKVYYQAA
jgi:hypothetical protein